MSDREDISYYMVSDGSYFDEGTLLFIQANEWHVLTEVVNGCFEEEIDGYSYIQMGYIEEIDEDEDGGIEIFLN